RQRPPTTSASSTSTSGSLSASRVSISLCIVLVIVLSNLFYAEKKAGGRPLSVLLPEPVLRHESCRSSIASGSPRGAPLGPPCVASRAVTIQAVVGAFRAQ